MALLSAAQINRLQREMPKILPGDVRWLLVAYKHETSPSGNPVRMTVTADTNNTTTMRYALEAALELSKDRGSLLAVTADEEDR